MLPDHVHHGAVAERDPDFLVGGDHFMDVGADRVDDERVWDPKFLYGRPAQDQRLVKTKGQPRVLPELC